MVDKNLEEQLLWIQAHVCYVNSARSSPAGYVCYVNSARSSPAGFIMPAHYAIRNSWYNALIQHTGHTHGQVTLQSVDTTGKYKSLWQMLTFHYEVSSPTTPNVIKWWSSLRRQLHKKFILPTFRLDAPILPKVRMILTLRRIGASNRNVGKISFLCSCLRRELHHFMTTGATENSLHLLQMCCLLMEH